MEKVRRTQERVTLTISREHQLGLAHLARETGDQNMSGLLRRYIEAEMRDRFGPNWRERLDEIESPDMAVA